MCKNALIIDSGEENKTKYSRIFILVLYWLKFDKTKEVKAKDTGENQSENKKSNVFFAVQQNI